MPVKEALEAFGKRVQQQARSNLTRQGKKNSGELYESVAFDLSVHRNSFSLSFNMLEYGMYVDQGVKGFRSSTKAPNSPFQFGSGTGKKGGLTDAMDRYVRQNRIQFRNRNNGKFISYDTTAFLIGRSVYNKGIKTTLFFTKPFENEFKKLPDDMVQAYGLEVNKMLTNALKR